MDKDGRILVFDAEPENILEDTIKQAQAGDERTKHNLKVMEGIDVDALPPQPAPKKEEEKAPADYHRVLRSSLVAGVAEISKKNALPDLYSDSAVTYTSRGVKYVTDKIEELKLKMGPRSKKLLNKALEQFSENNFISTKTITPAEKINRYIEIDIRKFAEKCNPKTIEQPKNCLADREKEKARAIMELNNERKLIKNAYNVLENTTLFWQNDEGEELSAPLLGLRSFSPPKGKISFNINADLAPFLVHTQKTWYLDDIYAIDDRKGNVLSLAEKMADHFFMYENHILGTADRLTVKTLLEVTDLPQYKAVLETDPPEIRERKEKDNAYLRKKGWWNRVKDPFETCLEALCNDNKEIGKNILSNWEYRKPLGKELTPAEIQNLDYDTWTKLLVVFTINKQPKEFLEDVAEQKAAAKALPKGKNGSKKGDKKTTKKAP